MNSFRMGKDVSVCIPTCDRPKHFTEALLSALNQSLTPREIIIGDDSSDRRTEYVIEKYETHNTPIKYLRNAPPLGQAKNVERILNEAKGEFVVLLHDDDKLKPDALNILRSCFDKEGNILAAFGKQQVIRPNGKVKPQTTQDINEGYYRTREYAGVSLSPLQSAILQQFPNDGYMVRTGAAKKVGYYHKDAGDACDFLFGVRLAQQSNGQFFYTNSYTSQYRQSRESIARGEGGDAAYRAFKFVLEKFPNEIKKDPLIRRWVERKAPVAIMVATNQDHPLEALKWFWGSHHRRLILTIGGMNRLLSILMCILRGEW